jgi:hypothetical protein
VTRGVTAKARHLRLVEASGVTPRDELADAPNPARWLADPTGRNDMRFWNGAQWSDRVTNDGVIGADAVRT